MTTGSSHCAAKVLNYTSLRSAVDPTILRPGFGSQAKTSILWLFVKWQYLLPYLKLDCEEYESKEKEAGIGPFVKVL